MHFELPAEISRPQGPPALHLDTSGLFQTERADTAVHHAAAETAGHLQAIYLPQTHPQRERAAEGDLATQGL